MGRRVFIQPRKTRWRLEKKVDGTRGSQLLEWEPEFELEYGIEKL